MLRAVLDGVAAVAGGLDRAAVIRGALAAVGSYVLIRSCVHPRHPQLTLEPMRATGLGGWFMGHLADLIDPSLHVELFSQWLADVHKPAFARLFQAPRIFLANPEDINYILNENISNFGKGRGYVVLQRILGRGLLTLLSDEEHAIHRRELSPAFSPASLKHIANHCIPQHVAELIADLTKRTESGATDIQLGGRIRESALEIIAQAAFRA
jgi:cytochrome P450